MSAPSGRNSESELGNVKERIRDYYVSRKQEMSAPGGRNSESEFGSGSKRLLCLMREEQSPSPTMGMRT